MWTETALTALLKITYPIIQAPMAGGATSPQLIANVANAGGLGSLAAGYMKPEIIRKNIKEIRSLTDKTFAVNLFVPEKYSATREKIYLISWRVKEKFALPIVKILMSNSMLLLKNRYPYLASLLEFHLINGWQN